MNQTPPGTYYLAGPTAVGKSDVAVALAERLGAEIVGCDAYQIYRGLPILTAQPEPALQKRVPHHLVGEVPSSEIVDVARYLGWAKDRIASVHDQGRHVVVAGGAGMYLRALTRGLADLPPADPILRAELERLPLAIQQSRLRELDPVSFQQIDLQNARRVIRALEVCILTGGRFSDFRNEWIQAPEHLKGALLYRSREELNARINARVNQMFNSGVMVEVAKVGPLSRTAEKALGLFEIQRVLVGELEEASAIFQIQQATRRYAKRQMTWFRRENWLEPLEVGTEESVSSVIDRLAQILRIP